MINCTPKLGGQFELESGGQFAPELVVNLTGFSTMLIAVQDLLKTCLNTIYNDENGNATEVENPIKHLKTLLEIAVQLLPINEGEVFDAVHKFVLKTKEFEKTDTL